jgi:CubicO group peptidase (beta-lactamase class C family)
MWIQPRTVANDARYASPVTLRLVGPDLWRGEVVPLDDVLAMYLLFTRQPDGALEAILRNPEQNLRGRYRVAVEGDRVRLERAGSAGDRLEGTLDAKAGRLSLSGPRLSFTLDLGRRGREDAVGFYARVTSGPYRYRPPESEPDGWSTGTLEAVGMEPRPVTALVQRLIDVDPVADDTPLVQGLLVARRGKLVVEEYFFGFHRERPHDLRSAAKTFTSILVGAARADGVKLSPDDRLLSFIRDDAAAAADPRKARITLAHLMSMSSGLSCDDNDPKSPGNEELMYGQEDQPDWLRWTLALPMAADPGSRYAYCTAGVNLAGGAVRNATGVWLPEYFRSHIAAPLEIDRFHWPLMPNGEGFAGGMVMMRPRDLLKIGQLYLDGGMWKGRRVVTKAWVEESTRPHMAVPDGSADGYDWHLVDLRTAARSYPAYYASGNGGQLLIVVPRLELVIVFTAANYNRYPIWKGFRDELAPKYILTAAEK